MASLIWRMSSTPLWEAASISSTSTCRLSMMAWQLRPSTGILTDAAHAGEDPGLRDAPGLECVRDRPHHGLLADQVVEGVGPVFAREHPVARPGTGRSRSTARRTGGCRGKIEARLREAAG